MAITATNISILNPGMAGAGMVLQPDDSYGLDAETGAETWELPVRGPYDELLTGAHGLDSSSYVTDSVRGTCYVRHVSVRRESGEWGVMTLTLAPRDTETGGEGKLLKETWHVKSCRNDVSVLAYCGSNKYAANRAWIECWQRESDAAVAKLFNYTKPDGTMAKLEDQLFHTATEDVIRKLMEGKESVMRFYPLLQRRRKYAAAPGNLMDALATVDAPPTPGANATNPVGLGAFVAKYEWLKCQDDIDEDEESNWFRVESWMGILKPAASDGHPWDPNFYSATVDDSANGWKIPHGAWQD